jgi:hypothetical protein
MARSGEDRLFTHRLLVVVAVALVLAAGAPRASAAALAPALQRAPVMQASGPTQQAATPAVPSHAGSRVAVQWGVFGVAAFTVIVVGSGAYLLRRRLGLVSPPPEQGGDAHH